MWRMLWLAFTQLPTPTKAGKIVDIKGERCYIAQENIKCGFSCLINHRLGQVIFWLIQGTLPPSDIETRPCQGGRISGKKGVIATTTGGNAQ